MYVNGADFRSACAFAYSDQCLDATPASSTEVLPADSIESTISLKSVWLLSACNQKS